MRRRLRGLTLAECLLAITILPLAVSAVSLAIISGQQQAMASLRQLRATELAQALMAEILSKPYHDPQGGTALGPEAGETARSLYDNIDDFLPPSGGQGFTEAAGSLYDAAGAAYPDAYQDFSRTVSGTAISVQVTSLGVNRPALQITVTVSDPAGAVVTLTRVVLDPE